jgi:hypothetical protein
MVELPHLPPFGVNQMLAMDEVINILLFATPNSWQVKMEEAELGSYGSHSH